MLGCSSAAKDHDFDPVDDYCDESNRLPVTTQPPSRYAGHPVEAGHPAPLPIGQLGTCEASTEGIECHNADPDAQPQAWCYQYQPLQAAGHQPVDEREPNRVT